MTREEAKHGMKENLRTYNKPLFEVDRIYDDFESRTCENCRYQSKITCPVYDYEYGTTPDIDGFGCNMFVKS